jgi:acyl-ACP thioesterase
MKRYGMESVMKYTFDSIVRYTETGTNGVLTIPGTINYFQDCSTFQSEELGVGVAHLREKGRVWMLNSWHVEFIKPVVMGTRIRVATWAYKFDHVFGYRNFTMEDETGTICAKADAKWVLYDLKKQALTRIGEEDTVAYDCGGEPPISMDYPACKLRKPKEAAEAGQFVVPYFFLDTNRHMNNEKYIELATDYIPADRTYKTVDVLYKNQSVRGDVIRILRSEDTDSVTITMMGETEQVIHAILRFAW